MRQLKISSPKYFKGSMTSRRYFILAQKANVDDLWLLREGCYRSFIAMDWGENFEES